MRQRDFDLDTTTRDVLLTIKARGRLLLVHPMVNRGTAFTFEERERLGLQGLLPNRVTTIEEQLRRVYAQYSRSPSPLAKFIQLQQLRDRNEVLFYRLLSEHLEEMMPIVYTPTIGEAIERFSHEYNGARAVFLSIDHPELIEQSLRNYGLEAEDVDLVVATDSEGILGIGDQGIGGVQIAVGKLGLYTAAAGIHPRRAIPVVLDVGTDNLGLLHSDVYLGERHARVRGERYEQFVDAFVAAVGKLFPHAMLHWEDFGAGNAHRLLNRYKDQICTFNDDIQGTAAVVLDVGTDNLGLLHSDVYLGERHARVRGERYEQFVDAFVAAVGKLFPHAMLHWEDFGAGNAHRLLNRYKDQICTFNDDIQGTAAVVLAAVLAAVRHTGVPLPQHRVLIYGAGTAGVGIADIIREAMERDGLPAELGYDRFYAFNSRSLIVDDSTGVRDFQLPYARGRAEVDGWEVADPARITLLEAVRAVKPTILIGSSAVPGAFTEEVVRAMAAHCDRPIIMPLSNPTSRIEALPADLLDWTDGRALIATGSPFGTVRHGDVYHSIAQANNALIFPGLGLGVSVVRASRVSDEMIAAAADALAGLANEYRPGASLLPSMSDLRLVSATVARAVAECAVRQGYAARPFTDPVDEIYQRMWKPEYPRIEVVAEG